MYHQLPLLVGKQLNAVHFRSSLSAVKNQLLNNSIGNNTKSHTVKTIRSFINSARSQSKQWFNLNIKKSALSGDLTTKAVLLGRFTSVGLVGFTTIKLISWKGKLNKDQN